jgi:mismatch-specific thymine-DNA glycosylase
VPQQLPDYLRPGLNVVFVGFNPGERSAAVGHYYAWPGNQFWRFLFESGLLREKLAHTEDHRLIEFGMGLTDLVKRWSKSAGELRPREFRDGKLLLAQRLRLAAGARVVAFNGKGAYEKFCGRSIKLGWQRERIHGARVFVLPSTSGRNGSLTRAEKLRYFRRLAQWVKRNER